MRSLPMRPAHFASRTAGAPHAQSRGLIPGLFEAFIPRGITIVDTDSILISMHPVGPNAGKPSMVVQVSRKTGAGIIRIYQIYNSDRTPFTGNVKGLTMTAAHVWTTDDAYDPCVPPCSACA